MFALAGVCVPSLRFSGWRVFDHESRDDVPARACLAGSITVECWRLLRWRMMGSRSCLDCLGLVHLSRAVWQVLILRIAAIPQIYAAVATCIG